MNIRISICTWICIYMHIYAYSRRMQTKGFIDTKVCQESVNIHIQGISKQYTYEYMYIDMYVDMYIHACIYTYSRCIQTKGFIDTKISQISVKDISDQCKYIYTRYFKTVYI